MIILISGGCKNGKSLYAQKIINLLAVDKEKYYIATMNPVDDEDNQRIIKHQQERKNWGYITIEQSTDIVKVTDVCIKDSSALIDSTTALLANEMFGSKLINDHAHIKVIDHFKYISKHFENLVFVSDYIYSDGGVYDETTEKYRYGLARIDRYLAEISDVVIEASVGLLNIHKGVEYFETSCWRSISGKT